MENETGTQERAGGDGSKEGGVSRVITFCRDFGVVVRGAGSPVSDVVVIGGVRFFNMSSKTIDFGVSYARIPPWARRLAYWLSRKP